MQSLTKIFRSSVRHAPQSRPACALPSVVTYKRPFASTSSLSRAENTDNSNPLQDLAAQLRDMPTPSTYVAPPPPSPEVQIKAFDTSDFIQPIDLTRGARTMKTSRRSKPWALGPGRAQAEKNDIFRQLDVDPLHEVFNSSLLSSYVTEMGKIRKRSETNLTWRSQRKLGKAIRRAKQMGIIPLYSRRGLQGSPAYRPFNRI